MCIFEYDEEATIQYIRECEFEQGKAEGKAEGSRLGEIAGTAKSLIVLLKMKGDLTEEQQKFIFSQTNTDTLQEWLKIAANVKTIEEFQKEIRK